MPVQRLDHVNLRACGAAFEALREFYCGVVGLRVGERPPLQSHGLWLYAGDAPVVHLVDAPQATECPAATTGWGTALDHVAFGCSGLEEMLGRITGSDVPKLVQVQSATGRIVVRLQDPSGLRVELLFAPEEGSAASLQCRRV